MRSVYFRLILFLRVVCAVGAIILPEGVCAQPMVQKLQIIGKTGDENPLNSIGMAAVYDCESSIAEGKTRYNSAIDTSLRYFYLSADSSSFAVTETQTLEDLLSSLSKWKDLLVLVHGYGDNLPRLANREPLLADMYNFDVLVFCWPSKIEAGGRVADFRATKDSISAAMPQFYTFLDELGNYVRKRNIKCTMMFHSLGNRFAMLLGEELAQNASSRPDISFIDNIVLNQACVPLKDYENWVIPLSQSIAGQVAITYNRNDIVLSIARSFSEYQPLLGQGPTKKKPFEPISKIKYVNFTQLLRWQDPHFSHNFYVRHPKDHPAKAREIITRYRKML